ncbi:MAG: cupredoxin domain-containing protein [Chloroflexi bacterium]|nr:cupredoxin domain-containing protein [Chloroflexota bacterium]
MTRRSIRGRLNVFAVSGGVVVALLGGVATVLAADHTVDISGFAFAPRTLTVAVGDTVTWANADAQGHTATADDAAFDTGTIAGNSSKSVTFTTAGTFAYHCAIHTTMTGTLTVTAAAATAAPTNRPGSTVPPTDGLAAPLAVNSTGPGAATAILLALAAFLGLAIGGRRFRPRAAER